MKDFKDNTRERSDREVIRRLITYMKPYKKQFFVVLILLLITIGIQLIPPLIIGRTIDIVSNSELTKDEKITQMIVMSAFFLGVLGLALGIQYVQNLMLQKIGQKTVVNIRNEVFNHIENLSIGQINQVPVGKLVTRVSNDTNAIGEMYTSVAVNLIRNVLFVVVVLVVLFIINYRITLWVILTIPVVILASVLFRKYSRASYRRVRANVSEVNAFLSENLSGMKVTQIFNQESKKTK